MKRTAEIASAGFIYYDKERRAQCVYCMEIVDFNGEHRPDMLEEVIVLYGPTNHSPEEAGPIKQDFVIR